MLALGVLCLAYWFFDSLNIIFFIQKPDYLLWYSSSGLLLMSIALILRSPALISVMFCALFALELSWTLDFIIRIFSGKSPLGITNYLFEPEFGKKDFLMSMYHLLIPAALLYAILKTKRIFRYSWAGAAIYLSTISLLTFIFADLSSDVNCVHTPDRCKGFLSPIITVVPYPFHILASILFVTILIFIPTNYMLLKIAKKNKWS